MMAEIAAPMMGRFGIASGDHSMNSQITSAYIDSMGEKAGVDGVAKDLRTYRREFDEGNLSVIGQIELKVGKKIHVKNMLTGKEETVDTLVSPEGRPAEYFMYEGESKVYKELLDKYHAVAESSDDVTALWVSHKEVTEENVGRNMRIFKLEKKGSDVLLTSYTAGGCEESGWRFMESVSGKQHDRSTSLHDTTAFFDQTVEHKKVYDTLVISLTADEKAASQRYLEKFQQEIAVPDDVRRKLNEQEEETIKKEIQEHPDVITGIGMYAQALAASVELSRKAYRKQDLNNGVKERKDIHILDEKRAKGILLLAQYTQLLSSVRQVDASANSSAAIHPVKESSGKEQIDKADGLLFVPALIYFAQYIDYTDAASLKNEPVVASEKTGEVNDLVLQKYILLKEEPMKQQVPFGIDMEPLPVLDGDLSYQKQDGAALFDDHMVQIRSDRNSPNDIHIGSKDKQRQSVVDFLIHEALPFSEKASMPVDIAQTAELLVASLQIAIPQLFESTHVDFIQRSGMVLQFIQLITSRITEKSDSHTQKDEDKLLQRFSLLTSLADRARSIPHIDTIITFLFFAAVADYRHQTSEYGLASVQDVFSLSDEDMEKFYEMAGYILHIDFKAEYSYQYWREIMLEALFVFVQELLLFAAEYKNFQRNGDQAQKKQHNQYTIEKLVHQSQLINRFARVKPVKQSGFPQVGLIYAYMPELLPLAGNM